VSQFNGKAFGRFLFKSFLKNRGTHYRLTAKRMGVLLLSLGIYLPVELITWAGLMLDDLLFPEYREVEVRQPIFIIGNPRSGTTFLQRLLAKDVDNFFSMKTWEIFAAPSLTMRKIILEGVKVARGVGMSVTKRIKRLERLWAEGNVIHRLALRAPEEDEYLFIHIFTAMKVWSFAAMVEEALPFVYYDHRMPAGEKQRMMDFYEACLQRHITFHRGTQKHYMAKNPNFSPMITTLLDRFPDAKFIYLVRNPLEAVPSHLSLKEREWQMLGMPLKEYASREFILESSEYWYNYPLEILEGLPEDQALIVNFDEMVADAENTVKKIYSRFGFKVSPAYQQILVEETQKARNHESQHEYSLEGLGLSAEELRVRFATIFERFDFPQRDGS
jgi:hypothetical protein